MHFDFYLIKKNLTTKLFLNRTLYEFQPFSLGAQQIKTLNLNIKSLETPQKCLNSCSLHLFVCNH